MVRPSLWAEKEPCASNAPVALPPAAEHDALPWESESGARDDVAAAAADDSAAAPTARLGGAKKGKQASAKAAAVATADAEDGIMQACLLRGLLQRPDPRAVPIYGGGVAQTWPPRVLVSSLFPAPAADADDDALLARYPAGKVVTVIDPPAAPKPAGAGAGAGAGDKLAALIAEATAKQGGKSAAAPIDAAGLAALREAAEIHRQVRRDVQCFLRPGVSLLTIAERIEASVAALVGRPADTNIPRGWGFPTGLSLNNVGAHFCPTSHDTGVILQQEDVLKVDFGVHINGRIVDCAFTAHFDPVYDPLAEAVREATEAGIRAAGVDARMCDIGAAVQEVMESHEVELHGRAYTVTPIKAFCGHSMAPYRIHAGKSVPSVRNKDRTRMEDGEVYAIETFGTTGTGNAYEDESCVSHFMLEEAMPDALVASLVAAGELSLSARARLLLRVIMAQFSTLAFTQRWIIAAAARAYPDKLGTEKLVMKALAELVEEDVLLALPALVEPYSARSGAGNKKKGTKNIVGGAGGANTTFSAQFEHTVIVKESGKEVVTRGDDY